MKKNKFVVYILILAIVLTSLFTLVACDVFNHDGTKGDTVCTHVDEDSNGICDKCHADMNTDCVHVDKNNDGKCDECHISVLVDFDFYAINDLHGTYVTNSSQTGVEGLTAYLLNAQANGNAYVLSSGDMWQGGSESNNTKGKLATEWLNYVNCVSMTLGNHEFDWGTDRIKSNEELADFPFLAINVYNRVTNERVEYCDSSIMIEKDGAKIGVIGAIGDCYDSISSSMCEDVYFKVGSELTTLVKAESQKLKENGADYIIYSLHAGMSGGNSSLETVYDNQMTWYDSALSDGYINLVFEGHTHSSYTIKDRYGVKHIQAGGYNNGISHADIQVNFANGNSTTSVNVVKSGTYSQYGTDNKINDIVEKYRDEIGNPDAVIGYNASYRKSNELCSTMAQLYYDKGIATWGDNYNIVLGGGFLKARSPYNLSAGNVTTRQIQTIFPFENAIMLCTIKGSDLKNRFFDTPQNYYASYGAYGTTIKNKLDSGQGLNDIYYVVVDSYTADYSWNNLTVVASLGDSVFPYQLMADYVKNGGFAS